MADDGDLLGFGSWLKKETVCFSETLRLPTSLHGAKTQKYIIIILTAVKTSNLTSMAYV
jgi:hypothetical protein